MGLKNWKCFDKPRKTLVERQTIERRPCLWKSSEMVISKREKPNPEFMKQLEEILRNYEPQFVECPTKQNDDVKKKPRRTLIERQADYKKDPNKQKYNKNISPQKQRREIPIIKKPLNEKKIREKQPCENQKINIKLISELIEEDVPNEEEQKRLDAYSDLLDTPDEEIMLNFGPDQLARRLRLMSVSEQRKFLMKLAITEWYDKWKNIDPTYLEGYTLDELLHSYAPCNQAKKQCRNLACPNVFLSRGQTLLYKLDMDGFHKWTPNRDGEIHTDFFETVWGKGIKEYDKKDTEKIDYCAENFPSTHPYIMENALSQYLNDKMNFHTKKIGLRF